MGKTVSSTVNPPGTYKTLATLAVAATAVFAFTAFAFAPALLPAVWITAAIGSAALFGFVGYMGHRQKQKNALAAAQEQAKAPERGRAREPEQGKEQEVQRKTNWAESVQYETEQAPEGQSR